MSDSAPVAPESAIQPIEAQAQSPIVYDPQNPASIYMDRGAFGQIQRIGAMLAASQLVPVHLQRKAADCALIVAQAFRWRLDPLAVAQRTFVVSGKVGYEGQLIAALVNTSGRTTGNLRYAYSGEGAQRRVTVTARLSAEPEDRTVTGTVAAWATRNERWREDPDAMLRYRGAREWARAHMPEVLLGIVAEEELDVIDTARQPDGSFVPVASVVASPEERIKAAAQSAAPAAPPPGCAHEAAVRHAAAHPGKAVTCTVCGEEISVRPAPPELPAVQAPPAREREPGEDDDEQPSGFAPASSALPPQPQASLIPQEAAHVDRPGSGRRGVR